MSWDFDRLEADVMDPSASTEPAPAFRIGKYLVGPELARGAMGVVHHGEDTELKRPVAVKILRDVAGSSPVIRQRFQREAQAAAMLVHPNVVRVYDAGEDGGRMYMVMELIDGHPLSKILGAARADLPSALRMLEKAARGVAAAHEKRIVHRDVKPANILITQSGEPKVGDFGLAHMMDAEVSLTQTGLPLGTPTYMAPEQVRGDTKHISPATDVYSLGAILYEILTGRPPHDADTSAEIYKRILETDPEPPRRRDSRTPRDIETIVMKALEREPFRRYPDAGAFADDLARHLAGEPILARPQGLPSKVWRKGVRHRRTIVPIAIAAAALLTWAAVLRFERAGRVQAAMTAALTLEGRDQLVEARGQYQVALGHDPSSIEALQGMTRVTEKLLNREKALAQTLKDLEVARPAIHLAELHCYSAVGRYESIARHVDAARRSIAKAIAEAPDASSAAAAWDLEGRALDLLGDEGQAEAAWRKAIGLDAGLGTPHYFLGRILSVRSFGLRDADRARAAQLADEAKKEFEAARQAGSGYDSEIQKAAADATLAIISSPDDKEPARKILREAIARFGSEPGTEVLHWLLGQVAGSADEELAEYGAAIRIRPNFPMALIRRAGHYYFTRHDVRAAFADLDTALERNPNFLPTYNTRGDISYRERDFVTAEADFSAMIRLQPREGGGWFNRGNARGAQGNFADAVADYGEAIALQPDWDAAYLYRGRAKRNLGDIKGALEDFAQALRCAPGRGDVLMDRAAVHERMGNIEAAIADLQTALDGAPADWNLRKLFEAERDRLKAIKKRDF